MSMIGEECHDEVEGGSSWNDNIEYDVQDGGPYSKGQDLPADLDLGQPARRLPCRPAETHLHPPMWRR